MPWIQKYSQALGTLPIPSEHPCQITQREINEIKSIVSVKIGIQLSKHLWNTKIKTEFIFATVLLRGCVIPVRF